MKLNESKLLLSTCFLHFWFCYENELVIWLSETGKRDSFRKSGMKLRLLHWAQSCHTAKHTAWRKGALKVPEIQLSCLRYC